jgi:catechol 2,3-dioxygenase-like lactoylglutathione lyase family enzyme
MMTRVALNRRQFGYALVSAGTLSGISSAAAETASANASSDASGAGGAQAPSQRSDVKQAPQQRPTIRMGSSDRQVLLSKITVSDLVRSYQFYTEIVGLRAASPLPPPTAADPEQDFRELSLNFAGQSSGESFFVLVKRRGVTPSREHAGLTNIGFKVPDPNAVLARAAQAGYPAGPTHTPFEGLQFSFLSDPDGYQVELIQAPSYPPA